jgi:hypothetical protein
MTTHQKYEAVRKQRRLRQDKLGYILNLAMDQGKV